jgi:ABC-type Mn2+/Zn2+ transport system permease subunit
MEDMIIQAKADYIRIKTEILKAEESGEIVTEKLQDDLGIVSIIGYILFLAFIYISHYYQLKPIPIMMTLFCTLAIVLYFLNKNKSN